jgi:diguanylate cyclase (GGDEF)-like protein
MPETSRHEAYRVAERVRQIVSDIPIEEENNVVRTTLSIGIAELSQENRDIDKLLKRADEALYEAKARGRNRVVGGPNA